MRAKNLFVFAASVLLALGVMQSAATAAITPVTGFTTDPIAYLGLGSAVANVIDGDTNHTPWLAMGLDGQGAGFAGPYTVTFDLGAAYDLTGFNLWNNGGAIEGDGEGVNAFTLTFFDPSSAIVGTFSGNATDVLAMQSFGFTALNVQTVDFEIVSNHSATRRYAIFHEIDFEGTPVVPVPGALLLAVTGLAGLVRIRARVRD